MQTVKLIIHGSFWDTQLYKGALYLFRTDASLDVINWGSLIENWSTSPNEKLAMRCAFSRSDFLYGENWQDILADQEVKSVIEAKFKRLGTQTLEIGPEHLERYRYSINDNPFPFPHADTTIHYDHFFTASRDGIFLENALSLVGSPQKRPAKKIWGCGVSSLDAYYKSLAIAAGNEGLFRWDFYNSWNDITQSEPKNIIPKNCADCHWMYYSILSSSHSGDGEFAEFEKPERDQKTAKLVSPGASSRTIPVRDILRDSSFAWGSKNRICSARDGTILVSTYKPRTKKMPAVFETPQRIPLAAWKGEAIAGAVTSYGAIVETEHALVVAKSNGQVETISGEPVNWRVFNRSRHYENQLHVVFEDRLEIWSFNHDYLVDQKTKRFGFTHTDPRWFTR